MNYLTELLAFYKWLETALISPVQQAYWHLLMWANNRAAVRDELGDWYWPVAFNLPNTVVMRFLGLKKHYQVVHLREQLIRTGRVQYEKHPAQKAGVYRLNPFNKGLETIWMSSAPSGGASFCSDKDRGGRRRPPFFCGLPAPGKSFPRGANYTGNFPRSVL